MNCAAGARPPHSSALRAALLSALIAIAAACDKKEESAPHARLVNVVRVHVDAANGDVAYSGEVRARYETNLSFRVAGKIVARNVEVGSSVRAGALRRLVPCQETCLNCNGANS